MPDLLREQIEARLAANAQPIAALMKELSALLAQIVETQRLLAEALRELRTLRQQGG